MADSTFFEKQLSEIVEEYDQAIKESQYDDGSDVITMSQAEGMQTRCLASIERLTSRGSVYYERASRILDYKSHAWYRLAGMVGIVRSLLFDLRKDYLKSLQEIVHADLFADFLEMAQHLLDRGYKDAAAVIAGSTLESHLRHLAGKVGLAVSSGGKPRKADSLNADLAKAGCYSKLDQKNVTAWLGLRNDAAHGNYAGYAESQVALLVSGIRDFLARTPA